MLLPHYEGDKAVGWHWNIRSLCTVGYLNNHCAAAKDYGAVTVEQNVSH